jgi:putative metalloprotease
MLEYKLKLDQLDLILSRLKEAFAKNLGASLDQVNLEIRNDKDINALADLKQNLIVLNTGMIDFANSFGIYSEDVLAAILAHELSHIYHKHKMKILPHFLLDLAGLISSLIKPTIGLPLWVIVKNILLSSSREQEKQADITGMKIARIAGYDPWGSVLFYEKFYQLRKYSISLFKTHPSSRERLKHLTEEVARCYY